jgi:hypothetical protein
MTDDTKFWLLISTSVLTAVVSMTVAILTNRRSIREIVLAERLKRETSHQEKLDADQEQKINQGLVVLDSAIRSIQIIKDKIQLIAQSFPGALPSAAAAEILSDTKTKILIAYAEALPELDDAEKDEFHSVKGSTAITLEVAQAELTKVVFASDLSQLTKDKLSHARDQLSEVQRSLRDMRLLRTIARKRQATLST